ncbi:hypothetical protein JCM21900_001176 [Sporobolomyces salmonicolor]
MAFLRKWGTGAAAGPPTAGGPNGTVGSAPGAAGVPAQGAAVTEWHMETPGEKYFGLENFGNTCYANSVIQSLYFSRPFRHLVETYLPYGTAPSAVPSSSKSSTHAPSSQPDLSTSPSSSALSTLSSAGRVAKSVGAALASPVPIPVSQAQARRSPPSRSGPPAGGGRGGFFAHRRQGSVSTMTSDSSAPVDCASSPTFGHPLTHSTTNTSFTGVGTPVLQNGTLARELAPPETTLLTTLRDLFSAISAQPKSTGTVAPQAFINQLKRDNEFFRSTLHQDAHEFLNFLVNALAEILEKEEKRRAQEEGRASSVSGTVFGEHAKTWVHSLFEGVLTNETRCLTCETVTSRDEAFLDLSIDIEQNSSVTSCLRQFSASEMLCQRNKFSCDKCCGLQEAEKRMKVKKLPNLLALHLKRFKYEEDLRRHVKLTYRVVFPFELRLFNTADDVQNPDRLYELWAIVVHIGVGPTHGHYITIVKSGTRWIVFDDNNVYPIEQSDISRYFGDTPGHGSAYCLFYQAVDLDSTFSGLPQAVPEGLRPRTMTTSSISTSGATGLSASWTEEGAPPVPPLPPASISSVAAKDSPAPSDDLPLAPAPCSPLPIPTALIDPTFSLDSPKSLAPSPLSPATPSAVPASPLGQNTVQLPSADSTPPQQRKASLVSLSGSSAGEREKEGEKSGWTLKGRFGRSRSQISTSRSVASQHGTPASVASSLEPVPSIPITNGNGHDAAPSAEQSVPPSPGEPSRGPIPEVLSYAPSSPALTSHGLPLPPTAVTDDVPQPSEDGSASTSSAAHSQPSSTQFLAPARRRSSRSSALDLPQRPSTATSLSSSGLFGPPANPSSLSTSPSATGALSAARGFLSRSRGADKPRPQSSHGGSLHPSPSMGVGLGLHTGPPVTDPPAPAPSQLAPPPASLLRAKLGKRPSTASPIVNPSGGGFFSPPRSFSLSSASPTATDGPSSSSSNPSTTSTPVTASALALAPAPRPLSKKEAEKRLKEEKKARETAAKQREKEQKELLKQMKEDAKRQEKLRRKMSVR